jgi:subtilisin
MRLRLLAAATLASSFAGLASTDLAAAGPPPPPPPPPLPAESSPYVAVLADSADSDAIDRLESTVNFHATDRYESAVNGFAGRLTPAQLATVSADPDVAFVTKDITFSAAALAPLAGGETVPVGIRRVRAATTSTAQSSADAAVAVLDTGLDLPNGDLNAVSGLNCVKPGTPAQDDNGHGTHVAGTLAARNNGAGVVGVAPGTRLYAVKVLGSKATGTLSQILCGIDWVTRNAAQLNIRVANMSLSGTGANDNNCGQSNADPQHLAICASTAAGISYVVSAGNANTNLAGAVPASYPEALTVTAATDTDGIPGAKGPTPCSRTDRDDRPWTSSNYAVATTDAAHVVAAPGTCIVSTRRGGGTTTMSGTSMATPHVTGALALCLGTGGTPGPCAGLTAAQIAKRVQSDAQVAGQSGWGFTGDPLTPITGKTYGHELSALAY